jgi:hypothetical protein
MQALSTSELALFFAAITTPSFVSLRGYTSSASGEVADHRLNVGLNYAAAQKADVLDYEAALANGTFKDEPALLAACQALYEAAKKNLDPETRSNQSQGARDSRETVGDDSPVFYNTTTGELFLQGYSQGKKVHVAGTHKATKKRPETIAKDEVKKRLGIRQASWRSYKISGIRAVRAKGQALVLDVCSDAFAA